MKQIAAVTVAAMMITMSSVAQEAGPPAPTPANEPVNPEGVQVAQRLMYLVHKQYRMAPAMTDSLTLEYHSDRGDVKQELSFSFEAVGSATIAWSGMKFTAYAERLFATRDGVTDKYYAGKIENGDLLKAMLAAIGDEIPLPPPLVLHYSADLNDQLKSLSLGLIENPKLLNSETTKNDAGKLVTEIRFGGDGGWGKLHITGDTHVLTDMQMEFQPKGQNPGGVVKVKGVFKPEIMDKLPTRIMFDTAGRKEVGSISDLVPDAPPQVGLPKVGADAPDFTLKTLSGEEITLSKLKGSVVVLDFWATWCGPCRKGLPFVQKFSDWAAESGKPIKVFAVDVWEHEETEAARKAAAEKFWTASKYTMPTLLDLDSKVGMQYGVPSIPTTIIIDANGKVSKIHNGLDPTKDLTEELKKDVEAALGAK